MVRSGAGFGLASKNYQFTTLYFIHILCKISAVVLDPGFFANPDSIRYLVHLKDFQAQR
jgi:hypothetical protein